MRQNLLIVNGALRGSDGNTARVLAAARASLPAEVEARELVLASYAGNVEDLEAELARADALLFGSGVYWGSWGSPLQRFLEVITSLEGSEAIVGKPAGVVVTMDSVGGSDVAQRLVGVLATLGCLVPPLPMVVVSRIGEALCGTPGNDDVWQIDDVTALVQNLLVATGARGLPWRSWPIQRTVALRGAYPASGPLDLGLPSFGFGTTAARGSSGS